MSRDAVEGRGGRCPPLLGSGSRRGASVPPADRHHRMNRFPVRHVALFIGAIAWAGSVKADAPSSPTPAASSSELEAILQESVVSTPPTASAAASTAPAVTSTISSEDLRRYGIRSLAEAINFLSVGMVSQESLIGGR